MAKITITDNAGLTADLTVRDDSPFAKARGSKLIIAAASLAGDLTSPIDQINFSKAKFGASFDDPSLLAIGPSALCINAEASGELSVIRSADETLLGDDGVSPAISIAPDECWIGVEIEGTLSGSSTLAGDGLAVAASGSKAVSFATYTLLKATNSSFPNLKDCLGTAIENYSLASSASTISKQKAGTVNVTNIGGMFTLTGSYSIPVNVNALASANLPFNYKIDVTPSATLELSGQITVSGDFEMRSHKVSETELRLGVYKKKSTSLSASLSAGVGIEAEHGGKDMLTSVLGVIFRGAMPENSGLSSSDAAALEPIVQESLDHSLSIALNLNCSASKANEAAVLYSIDLAGGDTAQTDAAINDALRGDWTQLDGLPNVRRLRNVVREKHVFQHKFTINLLGIYNAQSVADFVQSCTILQDDNGGIVITDKASASRISAAQIPYAANPDKLRSALADAFFATVTYSAAIKGGIKTAIMASQSYFFYQQNASRQQLADAILLGDRLGLFQSSDWSEIVTTNPRFSHLRVSVTAKYNGDSALRLFLENPATRAVRSQADLERIGRATMLALIDPNSPAADVRRSVLANDEIWASMNDTGNTATFGSIKGLSELRTTQLGAVGTDWVDVRWWVDSMVLIGAQLARLIAVVEASQSADPTQDAAFMDNRDELAADLAAVTRKTHAAFVGGWGLAVMSDLSGGTALTMDIGWDGAARHYEK